MALKTKDIKKTAQKVTKIAIKKAKSAADDVVERAGEVRDAVAKAAAPRIKIAKKAARSAAKDALNATAKKLKKAAKAL
jgi:hypothetical protein